MSIIGSIRDKIEGFNYILDLSLASSRQNKYTMQLNLENKYMGHISFFDNESDVLMKGIHVRRDYRKLHGLSLALMESLFVYSERQNKLFMDIERTHKPLLCLFLKKWGFEPKGEGELVDIIEANEKPVLIRLHKNTQTRKKLLKYKQDYKLTKVSTLPARNTVIVNVPYVKTDIGKNDYMRELATDRFDYFFG